MTKTYTRSDFNYELPYELIAQQPLAKRSASRLLQVDRQSGALSHRQFNELVDWLAPRDLLVVNNAKVIPARLLGVKETGGKIECMIERVLDDQRVLAQLRASKSPKVGARLFFAEGCIEASVLNRQQDLFELQFINGNALALLNQYGKLPLPPYIEREPNAEDQARYQTVFAKQVGAVAAPTAGLHFDEELFARIKSKGVSIAETTLYVGAGTFQPVRVEDITQHQMHSEYIELEQITCDAILQCQQRGGRVIAVGTTVVRVLESVMAKKGQITPYQGDTHLFIYPGFEFKVIDALITNFHLPQSTLLMLVSAFAGCELIQSAYQAAIEQKYRFFSYGDAMLID